MNRIDTNDYSFVSIMQAIFIYLACCRNEGQWININKSSYMIMSCFQAVSGRLGDAALRCHGGDAEIRLHGGLPACTHHTGPGNAELFDQQYFIEANISSSVRPPVSNKLFFNFQLDQINTLYCEVVLNVDWKMRKCYVAAGVK